jgi:hypothetical protein
MTDRLTRTRCARIARALEASEYPQDLGSRAAVIDVWHEVKAAVRAARRLDPSGRSTRRLHGELERRLRMLAARLDVLTREDRQSVVAEVLALAALGHAAGYAVQPLRRDFTRAPSVGDGLGTLAG